MRLQVNFLKIERSFNCCDLGSDLRPEDFLYSGINIEAQLSTDLLINLFATDTPLHDGAVLVKGNKIISAGVILPLSRQGISRYGTRHLAALGITERFDRCICIVVSEETGTLSLSNQGKLERPITSSGGTSYKIGRKSKFIRDKIICKQKHFVPKH